MRRVTLKRTALSWSGTLNGTKDQKERGPKETIKEEMETAQEVLLMTKIGMEIQETKIMVTGKVTANVHNIHDNPLDQDDASAGQLSPMQVNIVFQEVYRMMKGKQHGEGTSEDLHGSINFAVQETIPPIKWAAEFNAALTVPFFHWLVGPSEVIEVEVNGEKQRSGVLIKKCRYLENSGCVGMCVNMCKIRTQDFFTNEFGLPLTMNPNSEDMSCEMIYGQVPPLLEEDPAFKQPCFTELCSMANPNASICPKLGA